MVTLIKKKAKRQLTVNSSTVRFNQSVIKKKKKILKYYRTLQYSTYYHHKAYTFPSLRPDISTFLCKMEALRSFFLHGGNVYN